MGRKAKLAAAGATAVVTGPSGGRRFLGGCLVVILLGVLLLAGGGSVLVWLAAKDGGSKDNTLPCAPDTVAIAYTPTDTPAEVRNAVEDALRSAGRNPVEGGYGEGQTRDLVVFWWPTSADPEPPHVNRSNDPVNLRLMTTPTPAEVTTTLGDRLAPCTAPTPTTEPTTPINDETDADGFSWPWTGGWTATGMLLLALASWWTVGPQLVRGGWRAVRAALWPMRLAWRRWQWWAYRRQVRQGYAVPAAWPQRIQPSQRWAEDPATMLDRRTPRRQVQDTEPARRAALRAAIRAERLAGTGVFPIPVSVWQRIYKVPTGAPEVKGV